MLLDLLDALYDFPDTWPKLVEADLRWMATQADNPGYREHWTMQHWIHYISDDLTRWTGECKTARRNHYLWERERQAVRIWRQQLRSLRPTLKPRVPRPPPR